MFELCCAWFTLMKAPSTIVEGAFSFSPLRIENLFSYANGKKKKSIVLQKLLRAFIHCTYRRRIFNPNEVTKNEKPDIREADGGFHARYEQYDRIFNPNDVTKSSRYVGLFHFNKFI